MRFSLHNIPPSVLEKINQLYNLLLQRKKVYEQVSATVPDKEFQATLLMLAEESSEYAGELSSQVQHFGIIWQKERTTDTATCGILQNETEIMRFCKTNEVELVNAYYGILHESGLYGEVKKLVRCQLNGILNTFLKLKLLNVLKSR